MLIAIDLIIKRLQSKMSATNMRNFVCVLISILIDSGEKTDEGLQGERQWVEEMIYDKVGSIEDFKINRGQLITADAITAAREQWGQPGNSGQRR